MGIKINNFIVSILARLFKPVSLPKQLLELETAFNNTILVTQSSSIIFRALLLSITHKMGIRSETELKSQELQDLFSGKQSSISPLSWASLHEIEKIKADISIENSGLNFVTFNVFQVKGPIRKWPSFKPSFFWLWGLIPTRRILTISVGSRISINQPTTKRLIRLLKVDFVRTLKLVRGAPIESRDEQLKNIMSNPDFERELRIISERSGLSVSQGKQLTKQSFYELSASPRRYMYDALGLVARFILGRLFSDVRTSGLEKLIPAIKDKTVILVPMHRSHLDYVLVGYKLFTENVNPPFVAAGINLSFWPFGFLFRSVGAYFVKRNARDRFHAMTLKRYIGYLVRKGHLQEFFIEGGRSRSGKMLEPKLGLLSTVVEAAKYYRGRDILFVPVAITYENIVEDEAYGKENSGSSKVKETLISTLKAFDIFKRRYGEAIIEFADPISLSDFKNEYSANNISERNLVQSLGYTICRGIRNQTNPGLTSLGYSALLMTNHYGLKQKELIEKILQMHQTLEILRDCSFKIGTYTTQLDKFISGHTDVISDLTAANVMHSQEHFGDKYFYIPGTKRFTADYYRNSIIHYFFPMSLLALSELLWDSIELDKTETLYKFFREDLLLQDWSVYKEKLQNLCKALYSKQLMSWEADNKYIFNDKSIFFPAMLASYLQAYLWVVKYLISYNNLENSDPQNLSEGKLFVSKFIQKLTSSAKAEVYIGTITRTEATSRSTLSSVLQSLVARSLISISEGKEHDRAITILVDAEKSLKADLEILSKLNYRLNLYLLNQERD